VLDDALRLVLGGRTTGSTPRALHDVRSWVLADDPLYPFSFVSVCEILDIDPDRLRRALRPHLGLPVPRRPPLPVARSYTPKRRNSA
jgi:hypothetical protein